jgi:hypothetical protein
VTVLDFNRTNQSDEPINIALNASVAREVTTAPPRSIMNACAGCSSIKCATQNIRREHKDRCWKI